MNAGENNTAYQAMIIDENRHRIMSTALGNELEMILSDIFQDCEDFLTRFPIMAKRGDAEGIRVLCHAMKGVLAMLGLVGLSDCLEAREIMLSRGEIPSEKSVLTHFPERMAATRLALATQR